MDEFETAVRELGGTDEDLRMLADADFSGSDFEENTTDSKDLQNDVTKMWSELSKGHISEPEAKKDTKKTAKETKSNGKETSKVSSEDLKISKNSKDSGKDAANAKKETKKEPKEGKKKGDTIEKVTYKKDAEKQSKPLAKNHSKETQRKEIQHKEKPLSKKERAAWDDYINSLRHPGDLLIGDQDWSETASPDSNWIPLNTEILPSVYAKSQQMLVEENQLYFKSRQKDREFTSSLEFLRNGTFSDQLGTLSILATESPLHSTRFIETLVTKCEIKNRESACRALEVTKDLLVSHVLPDRRLRAFKEQAITVSTPKDVLVCFAFEDFLKKQFFRLLQTIERLLADTVENIRFRTLQCVFDLFSAKPEQEANLLRLSLNKLGDPAGKVASLVKRRLMDALQQHPGMKIVVASAMEELLARAHEYRLRYYAVDTLSEFIFSHKDKTLANKVVFIYLELFERLLIETKPDAGRESEGAKEKPRKGGKRWRAKRGKKGGIQQKVDQVEVEQQQQARLVAKLFTGLNRAFPFSDLDRKEFAKYTDTMYKMCHSPNVGTFIEALCFIFQLARLESGGIDRFLRALYDSLLDTRLAHSAKLGKYVHLVLKSMAELKDEREVPRAASFVKRLLQVALNWSEIGASASLVHVASLTPHHATLLQEGSAEPDSDADHGNDKYDAKQRDPRFAGAETSHAWEALLLSQHYHPTISLYARNFLAPEQDLAMPDIEQYSVNQFLSRWAYKKPKAKKEGAGGSIFQPLAGFTDLQLGVRFGSKRGDETPASMQDWKSKKRADIAPEEQFLYDYFVQRPDKPAKQDQPQEDYEELEEDEISEAMSRMGPGDQGNVDVDLDISESDGDDDEALEKALADDSDDGKDDSDGEGDSNGEGDSGDEGDLEGFEDMDGDLEGEDFAGLDGGSDDGLEVNEVDDDDDDFTNFEESAEPKKSRKRGWAQYPMFMDADKLDELEVKKPRRA